MQISNNNSLNQSHYLNAQKNLNNISSGNKLNSASDDAASLSISQNLKVQSSSYSQSLSNVNQAVALNQIADQSISEQSNILNTIKEKLLQASSDTTSSEGRTIILKDIQNLAKNLDNIASSTNYNGKYLLQENQNSQNPSESIQIQAGESSSDIIESTPIQANTEGLNLSSLLQEDSSTFTSSSARSYLDKVDSALDTLNEFRSEFGSNQNLLQSTARSLQNLYTQTQESYSVLTSSDIAKEVSDFNKSNILNQVGIFTQAQANNINQNRVSKLLF